MQGYKFTTEAEAIAARLQCDNHYGYPKQDCVTLHWVDFQHAELDGFYYIAFDESIQQVLGEPIEFEVTQPEITNN
jgi:hypothetical protein